MGHNIDPFQLEIMKNSFDAIADDMALTLMRTAHSGIVRDSMDFSTAICDEQGRTLAQGVCTPMQLGSFYDATAGQDEANDVAGLLRRQRHRGQRPLAGPTRVFVRTVVAASASPPDSVSAKQIQTL